jgi:glycosyltransferase involved in cell wall biosynthesis
LRITVILWGPFGHRADELAEAVGGTRRSITLLYGPRYLAPLRYLALFFRTLILLRAEDPDIVYAQNPPVFCPLACLLYFRLRGRRLVVDHHSVWRVKTLGGVAGALIGRIERLVSREAYANTAPHDVWARELGDMGARNVMVVHDHVERNPHTRDSAVRARYGADRFLAIASHGGHPLERIESEVGAAAATPGLTLVLTGPEEKLKARFASLKLPANARYLGLLPMTDYLALKASCDFALNITDEPFTLSHVIFEYLASGLPVISSRQEVVEDIFGDALLYADKSDSGEVAAKVQELLASKSLLEQYRERVASKYLQLESARTAEVTRLRSALSLVGSGFRHPSGVIPRGGTGSTEAAA